MRLRPALLGVVVVACLASNTWAVEKASEQVSPFFGSFGHGIPIEVPPFRGLEPHLSLIYSSEGRNGFVGVGWSLGGFSTIERTNAGGGTPRWDASDVYRLDGSKMLTCGWGVTSPGCAAGGTHATENENFKRIKRDAATNTWTVWEKSGVRSVYTAIMSAAQGSYRWGLHQVIDTKGNTVDYAWHCDTDCYPSTVTFGPYTVAMFREERPDVLSYARGADLGRTTQRLRSVIVSMPGVGHIRGYKLTYGSSPQTSRSLLTSVQQFGKDLVHTDGLISGGTSLPPHTFAYTTDPQGRTFVSQGDQPVSPPGTTEPVEWSELVNTEPIDPTNTLRKTDGGENGEWDARGTSTRALASGNGYIETVAAGGYVKRWGLSRKVKDFQPAEIDYAFETLGGVPGPVVVKAYEKGTVYGPWNANYGDVLRIEISGGAVQWKKNGTLLRERPAGMKVGYPLAGVAAITRRQEVVGPVTLSGSLRDVAGWCWGEQLLTGDFNGDGRTDQACYTSLTQAMRVRLSTGSGFADPAVWRTGYDYSKSVTGDFDNDGKTDIAAFSQYGSTFSVSLSTGSGFADAVEWGHAAVTDPATGFHYNCETPYAALGAGDFDGDGRLDVSCRRADSGNPTDPSAIIVGRSTGTSFQFAFWGSLGCDAPAYQSTGAIDFDGDGKDDWYCLGGGGNLQVYVSTGSEFIFPAFGSLGPSFCGAHYVLGDFNADGRTDAHCVDNGKIALSTGRSFVEQGTYGSWCAFLPGEEDPTTQVFAADVDGDGASEIVCNNAVGAVNDIQVRDWSDASGLGAAETWKTSWCEGQLRGGDFDGDAKVDLLCDKLATPVASGGETARPPDLLQTVTVPLGGSLTAAYTPSSAFLNQNNPPVRYAVTSTTTNDGRGGLATTSYTYSGGFMDRKERRYLGFQYSRLTRPCLPGESACPYAELWFRLDTVAGSRIERVEAKSGAGALLAKAELEYQQSAPAAPFTLLPTASTAYSYGAPGEVKRTGSTRTHDAWANALTAVEHGDLDATGDERTTAWQYAPNTAAYIVSRPWLRTLHAGEETGGEVLRQTRYGYDGSQNPGTPPTAGLLTREERWVDTTGTWEPTSATFDAWGNLESVTDVAGGSGTVTMDPARHLFPVSVTNAVGETTTTAWDELCAAPTSTTDVNGQAATTQYDALCRVFRSDGPLGAWETTAYLDLGNPQLQRTRSEAASPTGSGTAFSQAYLDGFGRAYRTEASGPIPAKTIVSEAGWNARGGVAWSTQPRYSGDPAVTTTLGYDALDRTTHTHLPDGNVITAQYGAWGSIVTDPLGHAVAAYRDAFGRTVRQEEQDDQGRTLATTYGYSLAGDLVSMADAADNTWSWTFDSLGRLVSRLDPDSGTRTFAYNSLGRTVTETDAKGQTTQITSDPAWRPLQRTTSGLGGETTTWQYGESRSGYFNAGRLTTMTDAHGSQRFDYDALGRPVRETRTLEGVDYVLQRRFSASGHLAGVTFPDGEAVGTPGQPILYDGAGRVSLVPGFVTSVEYDALGRPKVRVNGNGTTSTWNYDLLRGWLTHLETTGGGEGGIQALDYTVNALGQVTQVTSPFPDESWSYEYDELGRLTQATNLYAPFESQGFQYDAVGNKTYDSRLGAITYPPAGSTRPHAPQQVAGSTLLYDGNGNLTSGRGRSYTWNVDNLPTQINSTAFLYDGGGARLKKTSAAATSLYPVGSYEVRDGVVTKYVSLPGLGSVAKRTGGHTYWLHSDRLGSVQAVTDASGAVVKRRSYRPYGQALSQSGTHWEPLGYIGERFDDETGLQYLNARYFDAELGSFVSADPLEPFESGVNRYGYGYGNPIMYSDPSGLLGGGVGFHNSECGPAHSNDPICGDRGTNITNIGAGQGGGLGTALILWLIDLVRGGDDDRPGSGSPPPAVAPPAVNPPVSPIAPVFLITPIEPAPVDGSGGAGSGASTVPATVSGGGSGGSPGLDVTPAPGFWGGLVPVYGTVMNARHNFDTGQIGWGTVYSGLAVSDVFLVRSIATGVVRGGWRTLGFKTGGHSWSRTRVWLRQTGFAGLGQHVHHPIVPQRLYSGPTAKAIFNQPWNLKALVPPAGIDPGRWHMMVEGRLAGLNAAQRWWHGTPAWAKSAEVSMGGRVAGAFSEQDDVE